MGCEVSGNGQSDSRGEVDELTSIAQPLYNRSCIGCHGTDLNGASAPGLLNTGLSRQEFIDFTYEGVGLMPGKLVSLEDAEIITDWIIQMEENMNK
nr:cytochrome c [Evansella tamaricis]